MKRCLSILLATLLLLICIPLSVHAQSNVETIFAFLREEIGFNSAAACGVLANIEKESSFNPNAFGDNGASYGICQWNTFRFDALRGWCETNGHDYTTLEGQLHYLQFELSANNSNYLWNGKTIRNKLMAVADTAEGAYAAAYDWCYYFEVPANKAKRSVERGDLAVSAYWPVYGAGDPAPTVTQTLSCDYAITVSANSGEILLYDRPAIDVESERRLENQPETFVIHCSEKILLSNGAVRYYFYSEDEQRGYYLPWNPSQMTLQQTHTWSEWEMVKASTCQKSGLEKRACSCGTEETRAIGKKAHTYKKVTQKATTTKDGKVKHVCTECGYTASKVTTIYKASKISLSKTSYAYNGKAHKPSVVVKDAKGKTISTANYTVTYAGGRKNVGTYKVTVKMKGNYSGTKTLTFKVNPVKTMVKATAAKKSLKLAISKKSTQVTGYQVQYSTSKSFKSYKTKWLTSYKKTSLTLTGLKAKTTYYVRVRTYKKVNGTTYYSGWSTIIYKKTK